MSKRFTLLFAVCSLAAASLLAAPPSKAPQEPTINTPEDGVYIAERAIVRDVKSGAVRKPTVQETAQMVKSLKALTSRSNAPFQVRSTSRGAMLVDNNAYNMVVIGRATEEGGYETTCVATFEEAAQFLGLKAAPTSQAVKPEGANQ